MDTIFNQTEVTDADNGKEPDWNRQYKGAKTLLEKAEVMQRQKNWKAEQHSKAHAERQQSQQQKLDAVLAIPQVKRNKVFWDNLLKVDPYTHSQLRRQQQEDRKALGFAFQLKG